jgi:hypothetical protein
LAFYRVEDWRLAIAVRNGLGRWIANLDVVLSQVKIKGNSPLSDMIVFLLRAIKYKVIAVLAISR